MTQTVFSWKMADLSRLIFDSTYHPTSHLHLSFCSINKCIHLLIIMHCVLFTHTCCVLLTHTHCFSPIFHPHTSHFSPTDDYFSSSTLVHYLSPIHDVYFSPTHYIFHPCTIQVYTSYMIHPYLIHNAYTLYHICFTHTLCI